jgi:protein TonB
MVKINFKLFLYAFPMKIHNFAVQSLQGFMKKTFTTFLCHFAQLVGCCGIFWLTALSVQAQNYSTASLTPSQEDKIYPMAETPPAPEGGLSVFFEYTEDNLDCPAEAKKKGVKGNVYVQFVVEKDGQLSNIKVVKGLGYGCDEAVIKCLQSAPRWKAGKQGGKPVRVQKTMAIQIK